MKHLTEIMQRVEAGHAQHHVRAGRDGSIRRPEPGMPEPIAAPRTLDDLNSLEACHDHIRDLRRWIEWLEAALKFCTQSTLPTTGGNLAGQIAVASAYRAYKVMAYDCQRKCTSYDGFGVYAEFSSLEEAVDHCRACIDEQMSAEIRDAENGVLCTARQVDAAIERLALFGWNYWVNNKSDPKARDAFEFRTYARQRLMEIIARKQSRSP